MTSAIICYLSYSGNTEEVAEIIEQELEDAGINVVMYEIGFGVTPDLSQYDYIFIGTFTWDYGATPDEVKDFVLDIGYKPSNIHIFGSGDTQFGEDGHFCIAVDKLAKFYNSKSLPLKVEQAPRGQQESFVKDWTKKIIKRGN